MFSFSVPKHAPSKLIDGKIILGGMGRVGGKAHKGPWGQKVWSAGWAYDENEKLIYFQVREKVTGMPGGSISNKKKKVLQVFDAAW